MAVLNQENLSYFGRDLEAMSFAENYHAWIREEFAESLTGDVAEIGAGIGNFTEEVLKCEPKSVVTFEPSSNMYPHLEKRFADNEAVATHNGFFEEVASNYLESFDSVLLVNVLEHIEDDRNTLEKIQQTLRPRGRLLLFVPALPFLFSDLDREVGHFRRYTKKELETKVLDKGFDLVKSKYFDMVGIVPWYIAYVLFKQQVTPGSVSLYDKVVIPLMKPFETRIHPPIGKNLLLVAEKLA